MKKIEKLEITREPNNGHILNMMELWSLFFLKVKFLFNFQIKA